MITSAKPLKSQKGFTLVELTLAISFIGVLLMLASAIIVQSIGIYNKGVAVKQINQAGRSLIDDISRISTGGYEVKLDDNGKTGYLCIKDSNIWRAYVWNSQELQVFSPTDLPGKFTLGGKDISLVRSNDGVNGDPYCYLPTADAAMNAAAVTPLLSERIQILAVNITQSSETKLKKVSFWIGTGTTGGKQDVIFDAATDTWSCPGGALGEFCAVFKYETVIYTSSKEGA